MKRGSIILLKVAIFAIGILALTLCIFALPTMARNAVDLNPEFAYLQYPILLGLYLTLIPFFFALYQGLKLLRYIESNNTFSESAINALGLIKNCATVIILLYLLGIIILAVQSALHPGIAIMGFVILFATLVILLFTAVLQELLKNALKIKLENDLTI